MGQVFLLHNTYRYIHSEIGNNYYCKEEEIISEKI